MNDLREKIESKVGDQINCKLEGFALAVDRLEADINAAADTARSAEIERRIKAIDLTVIVAAISSKTRQKRRAKGTAEVTAKASLPLPPPPLPPIFKTGGEQ